MASKQVESTEPAQGVTITKAQQAAEALAEMVAAVNLEIVNDLTGEEQALMILGEILGANSMEEMGGGVLHASDVLDQVITVHRVTWQRSDFEEQGLDFYAVMHGTLHDGSPVTVTCGGISVVATMYKLRKESWLPARVMLRQSTKKTAAGFYPINIQVLGSDF